MKGFALLSPLSYNKMIGLGAGYLAARLMYAVAYIGIENETLSYVRSIFWWTSNGICFWAIVEGARVFNA